MFQTIENWQDIIIIAPMATFKGDYPIMEASFPLHEKVNFNLSKRKKWCWSNVYRSIIL